MGEMMVRDKCTVILLAVFTILNSLHVISLVSLTISGHSKSIRSVKEDPNKTKNKNPGGGTYKTKEEVEKAPTKDITEQLIVKIRAYSVVSSKPSHHFSQIIIN